MAFRERQDKGATHWLWYQLAVYLQHRVSLNNLPSQTMIMIINEVYKVESKIQKQVTSSVFSNVQNALWYLDIHKKYLKVKISL